MIGAPGKRESRISPKIPPIFEEVLLDLGKELGGVCFAVRENSSTPLYEDRGAPKPPNVKGKISNQPPVEGYLIEINASAILGKVVGDKILKHEEKDIPKNLQTTQGKRSLNYYLQGLSSTPPKFELVDKPGVDGVLRVRAISDIKSVNQVIHSIDLNDEKATSSLVDMKDLGKVKRSSHINADQPDWWLEKFGEFSEKVNKRFPMSYQENFEAPLKPVMVYALSSKVELPKNDDTSLIPIVSDQDLGWITMPKELFSRLKELNKLYANTPFDTREDVDGVPRGYMNMKKALIQIGHDLAEIRDANGNLMAPDHEPLFGSDDDFSDADKVKIAQFGILTPFEAYIVFNINKTLGLSIDHILDLIQHGAENRNPYKSEALSNINLIGQFKDEKGKWHDMSTFVETEKQLVNMILNTGYLERNIFTVHPNWNMELWSKVIERQIKLDHPVSDKTLEKYHEYMASSPDLSQSFIVQTPTRKNLMAFVTDDTMPALEKLAGENSWQLEQKGGNIYIHIDQSVSPSIIISEKGFESSHSGEKYLNALAKLCDEFKLQRQDLYIGDREVERNLANCMAGMDDKPQINLNRGR